MLEYRIFEETLSSEGIGTYVSYGIKGFNITETGAPCVATVSDISTDRAFVERLAEKCTIGQLSPIHLIDVVEDALV